MADRPGDISLTAPSNGRYGAHSTSSDADPGGHGTIPSEVEVIIPTNIVKRDGRVVPFELERIEAALAKCFGSFGRSPATPISELARRVVNIIAAKSAGADPSVEEVQDIVEMVLQAAGEFEAAKRYILYRAA